MVWPTLGSRTAKEQEQELLTPSFPFPLPSPLEGLGERYSSRSGAGRSAAAKRRFVQFTAKILQIKSRGQDAHAA